MPRIVAGAARGRPLVVPAGRGTRPTSDRAREGLFSSLLSLGWVPAGSRFLDLYAGSGAVGLEALSRGAAAALLVEADTRAARVIRANARAVGLPGAQVVCRKVLSVLAQPAHAAGAGSYDVAFLDPAYDASDDEVRTVLRRGVDNGWLAPSALVVVERATRGGRFTWPPGFDPERTRGYGEGTLWYGRAAVDGVADSTSEGSGV